MAYGWILNLPSKLNRMIRGIEMAEFSEDAARKAYDDALLPVLDVPMETRKLLESQRQEMKIFAESSEIKNAVCIDFYFIL